MNSSIENISPVEIHNAAHAIKINWLRAAVLGANDGLIAISSIVVGVASATSSTNFILTAGVTSLMAGALSMGVGEYVSVSSQRDTEKALLEKELFELDNNPEAELGELVSLYEKKGLSKSTARIVAEELTTHDVLAAHAHIELGIDPNNLTNPLHAAYASAAAFLCGGIIPIFAMFVSPDSVRIPVTFFAALMGLFFIGFLSAKVGGANKFNAIMRVVVGGIIAMLVTFGVGNLFKITGI